MRWLWLLLAFVAVGCSLSHRKPTIPPMRGATQEGVASWYGPGFNGNPTSSGEIYDQYDLTAAHQTLPLGTRVAVTYLATGRTVEVRINDRGPFVDDRIIDLSYAAARQLGLVGPGTGRVRLEVLGGETTLVASRFAVQVGAFADPGNADRLRQQLSSRFGAVHVSTLESGSNRYYRVRLGPFPGRDSALSQARQVAALGLPAVVVEDGH